MFEYLILFLVLRQCTYMFFHAHKPESWEGKREREKEKERETVPTPGDFAIQQV